MAVPLAAVAVVCLHLLAFVFAVGAEMRRNTGKVVPDEYDERAYCMYGSDASTAYGLAAAVLLLLSHAALTVATRCLCFNSDLAGRPRCRAVGTFFFSWFFFLAAEACLIAGSARNAYHTKYLGYYAKRDMITCATLRKGIFAAAAALILVSLVASLAYYWIHSSASTAGWQKHRNEVDVGMADLNPPRDGFVGGKP